MTIRTHRRRSKNDDGKQQFSLDVQTRGCDELIARMELASSHEPTMSTMVAQATTSSIARALEA